MNQKKYKLISKVLLYSMLYLKKIFLIYTYSQLESYALLFWEKQ